MKAFFAAYDRNDGTAALKLKAALADPLDRKIADWMIATTSTRGFSSSVLRESRAALSGWPGQDIMELAFENTLVKQGEASLAVARALPERPLSNEGKLLQVQSYLAGGERAKAAALIQDYWASETFTPALEGTISRKYGNLLSPKHHKARADRLLYDERVNGALRLLPRLSKTDQALVNARAAVIRQDARAGRLLDALPESAKREPGYFFARAQHLRRADKWLEAGKTIDAAPTDQATLGDPDQWWSERRLISRKVLEAGDARLAYRIASRHAAKGDIARVDAEFHSGWYALRFLNDPATALGHFEKIAAISEMPLSRSRAYYWMARAYQASGDKARALEHYGTAAHYDHTYYGQLALEALGRNQIPLHQPSITTAAQRSFDAHELVRAIRRLKEAGEPERTRFFYSHLAETMENPAELTLLAELALKDGLYPTSLQIGKLALARGVDVPHLAFPLGAIPDSARLSKVHKALAYAIARQESAFDKTVISRADARGLMQLLPSTAKQTARSIGVPYKLALLTQDAGYNARLGSAFLNQLIDRFGGSYVLAFAGYNAGPSRAREWMTRFGDPRKNATDAVDWVESIPFSETRNYVQRVMENLQIYRQRLEGAPLAITKDLNRGLPS